MSAINRYIKAVAVSGSVMGLGYFLMTWTDKQGTVIEDKLRNHPDYKHAISEEQKRKRLLMENVFENARSDRPVWDVRW